jgi:nitroimidazol reductase NimA-like FMN-containing flavoprotein (pyridoxamine 5'-phosphate oxidase superfamily)
VRRKRERASYDRETVWAILDEGFICHVGIDDGGPVVLPTLYAREGDTLYLHGAPANRMLRVLGGEGPACVTVTLVDGLVLARSTRTHSLNYRSVVAFGTACVLRSEEEKAVALERLVEHLLPGRSEEVRSPSSEELTATAVVAFEIEEASAKIRSGPPLDLDADLSSSAWAGVVPVLLRLGDPIPDRLRGKVALPRSVTAFTSRHANGQKHIG